MDKNDKRTLYEIQSNVDYLDFEFAAQVCKEHSNDIKQAVVILHDKDTYTEEEAAKYNEDHKDKPDFVPVKAGDPKKDHVHVFIKLKTSRRRCDIAGWFNLGWTFVRDSSSFSEYTSGKGDAKWDDMILYAFHLNALEKHQYDISEAWSMGFVNLSDEIDTIIERKANNKDLNDIIEMIDQKIITRNNYTKYMSSKFYVNNKKTLNDHWDYAEADKKLNNNTRNMDVIYIWGNEGLGKSRAIDIIAERYNLICSKSGIQKGTFEFIGDSQLYGLDEVRPDMFNSSEWLSITDNYNERPLPARFHNGSFSGVKKLVITTNMSPEDFWKCVQENSKTNEKPEQWYRRLGTVKHFRDDGTIATKYWLEESHRFSEEYITPNTYLNKINRHDLTEEEQLKRTMKDDGIEDSSLVEKISSPDSETEDVRIRYRVGKNGEFGIVIDDNTNSEINREILNAVKSVLNKYDKKIIPFEPPLSKDKTSLRIDDEKSVLVVNSASEDIIDFLNSMRPDIEHLMLEHDSNVPKESEKLP